MATAVQITITVDPSNSSQAIDGIQSKLNEMGVVGQASAKKIGDGLQQQQGHMATSLDTVRLLSQEFGLRLPRAMESMLSRSQALSTVLGGMLGGLTAIGAAEVFIRMADGVHKLYDEYISLNAVAEKYADTLERARQADIPQARTSETAQLRMRDQTQAGFADQSKSESMSSSALQQLKAAFLLPGANGPSPTLNGVFGAPVDLYQAHGLAETASKAQTAVNGLTMTSIQQQHQAALDAIDAKHAMDAELEGVAKVNAELQKKIELNAEARKYDNQLDRFAGNEVAPNAGAQDEGRKNQQATREAMAQKVLLDREANLAIMKSDDARVQAGLSGEDLYARKMQDDIREMTVELTNAGKAAEIPARVRELKEKYFDDASERLVKLQNEAGLAMDRASAAGLTGAAKIHADHNIRINEINTNPELAANPDAAAAQRRAAQTEADQQLLALQQQFSSQMQQIEEQRVDATLNGYQKIDAAAQREVDRVSQEYDKNFGGSDQSSGPAVAAQKSKQDAITAIQAQADQQRKQLDQQNQLEDMRYDQEAMQAEKKVHEDGALGWITANKNAIAEIQQQEQERLAKLQEDAQKEGLTYEEVARRRADIEQTASAQVEAQAQELQHKISGTLQSAFRDPVGTIKSEMEKMMFDILSAWIAKLTIFKQLFGNSVAGMQPGAAGAGASGGSTSALNAANIAGLARGTAGWGTATVPAGAGSSSGAMVSHLSGSSSTGSVSFGAPDGNAASVPGFHGPAAGASNSGGFSIGSAVGDVKNVQGLAKTLGIGGSGAGAGSSGVPLNTDGSVDLSQMPGMSDSGVAGLPGMGGSIPTFPGVGGSGSASAAGASTAVTALSTGASIGAGGYELYSSTENAFEKGSPISGALGDAAAGAMIGSVVPGIGTAVGAGVGAAIGLASGLTGMLTGESGKLGARDYYKNTLLPQIEQYRNGSNGVDFQAAISQIDSTGRDGMSYMRQHFGDDAANYVWDNYLQKEVQLADASIANHAQGGAQYVQMSAGQFHTGGYIDGFGDLSTSGNEGYIHAMMGESVVNRQATSLHAPVINAMNSGASSSDVAAMYLAGAGSGSAPSMSAGSTSHNWNVQAIDANSFQKMLRGGGARVVQKELNNFASKYAGDGISG